MTKGDESGSFGSKSDVYLKNKSNIPEIVEPQIEAIDHMQGVSDENGSRSKSKSQNIELHPSDFYVNNDQDKSSSHSISIEAESSKSS